MEKAALYIGSCIDDLNKKAVYQFDSYRSTKIHINHSEKTYQAAEEACLKGDEERGYILYMRYVDVFQKVRNSRDYKKDESHYSLLLGTTKVRSAISHAEELAESLKKRYEAKKSLSCSNNDRRKNGEALSENASVPHNGGQHSPLASTGTKQQLIPADAKSISCEKLYEVLFSKLASECHALLIDIRMPDEFASSHIRHSQCINIPKVLIKPGTVCKRIEDGIQNHNYLNLWRHRNEMDLIVLIDWFSAVKDLDDMSCALRNLIDALTKWEQELELTRDPVILVEGYSDWLDYYPQFSTNPKIERPRRQVKGVNSIASLADFSFNDLIASHLSNKDKETRTLAVAGGILKDDDNRNDAIHSENTKDSSEILPVMDSHFPESAKSPEPIDSSAMNGHIPRTNSLIKNDIPISKPTPQSDPHAKDKTKKNIPTVDRETKPVHLTTHPNASLLKQTESPLLPNHLSSDLDDLFSTHSQIESSGKKVEGNHQTKKELKGEGSDSDDIFSMQSRIEASRRKIEGEEQKKKELEKKRKLVELQTLEKQLVLAAEAEEKKRKLAEKELADAMRELRKPVTDQKPYDTNEIKSITDGSTSVKDNNSNMGATTNQETHSINKSSDGKDQPISNDEQRASTEKTREIHSVQRNTPKIPQNASDVKKIGDEKPETNRKREDSSDVNKGNKKSLQKKLDPPVVISSKTTSIPSNNLKVRTETKPPTQLIAPKSLPELPSTGQDEKFTARLPLEWEKRLDRKTGRYYFLDHTTKTTHWMLPSDVIESRKVSPPKNVAISGGGSLKRSSSSPNIAQLIEDEIIKPKPTIPSRQNKPRLESSAIPDPPDEYALRLARLHPTFGGRGPGICGLMNLGNTCYMNSVLQCMFNTTFLAQYFLTNQYKRDINRDNFLGSGGEITDGFALLMKASWEGKFKHLTPRDFRQTIAKFNPRFGGYSQQDSQELLLFLMDGLHEDLNLITERKYEEENDNDGLPDIQAAEKAWEYHKRLNKSIIVELFQGQFKATVQCVHCRKTSRKFDVFMYLSLPLPSDGCSINDCIENFSEVEKLSGDNKWRCPACKTEREAVRRMEIWKLPSVLLIHFKRFSFCGRWGDKVQTTVKFPAEDLNLNKYVKGPKIRKTYQLYSVSHHYGASLDSGHYVASCKSPINGNWYKYDDHEVTRTSVPQGPSSYILCYTSLKHFLNLTPHA